MTLDTATTSTTSHKAAALTAASALAMYDVAESNADKVRAAAAMAEVLRQQTSKAPKKAKPPCDLLTAENLTVTLKRLCAIIERRGYTSPVLNHVLLESDGAGQLRLTATNMDVMYVEVMRALDPLPAFALTVEAAALAIAVRGERGDVGLEPVGDDLCVACGGLTFKLPTLSAKEMPIMEVPGSKPISAVMPASRLLDPLRFVECSISSEETRYYLNGAFMHVRHVEGRDRLIFVATDGSRMMVDTGDDSAGLPRFDGMILPRKSVSWLLRNLRDDEVEVEIWATHARFRTATGCYLTKLIDGNFPDYARVIPRADEATTTLFVDNPAAAAIVASKLGARSGSQRNYIVLLDVDEFGAKASSRNTNGSEAEAAFPAAVQLNGCGPKTVAFNGARLAEMLAVDGEVSLRLMDPNDPALFTWESVPGRCGVLKPLRV